MTYVQKNWCANLQVSAICCAALAKLPSQLCNKWNGHHMIENLEIFKNFAFQLSDIILQMRAF